MTDKSSVAFMRQWIQQTDDKHEAGHTRLRMDYRELEKRVMAVERAYTDYALDFTRLQTKSELPIDGSTISLSTKQWAAITTFVLAMAGAAWSSAAWVKSDIAAIRTEMIVSTKLQEERAGTTKTALDKLDAKSTLQQMKIDEITTALKVRGIIR
jgi:hypothetical protein